MTIIEQLNQLREQICDDYCKYSEEIRQAATDKEYEELLSEHCDSCPLNML